MKKIITIFSLVVLGLFPQYVHAQTDSCIVQLQGGIGLYQLNEFDECIYRLEALANTCAFEKQEQLELYKTLILAYLSIDALEKADEVTQSVIALDPLYQPDLSKEDPRLLEVFSKYTTVPSFRLGFSLGANLSKMHIRQEYSMIHRTTSGDIGAYDSRWGYMAGMHADIRMSKGWWLQGGLAYQRTFYGHELFNVDGATVSYKEDLDMIVLPIMMQREFGNDAIRPYVNIGPQLIFLNQALSQTTRGENSDLANRTALRHQWNVSAAVAIGISTEMGAFRYSLDLGYDYQFRKLNDPAMRYADELNSYKYFYIDDDINLGVLQVSLKISQALRYKRLNVH